MIDDNNHQKRITLKIRDEKPIYSIWSGISDQAAADLRTRAVARKEKELGIKVEKS